MKRLLALFTILLFLTPFASAYGVTFYNPAWDPQDGKVFEVVEPDQLYVFNIKNDDLSLTKVSFMINREAKNGGVTIYSLQNSPDKIPELDVNTTYDLIEVKYSGFVPHDTTKFMYEFKVAKDWLESNSIPRNAIALHTYNRVLDLWEVTPTKVESDDDEFVYFSAGDDEGVHYLFIGKMIEGYDTSMAEDVEEVAEEKTEEQATPPAEPVEMSAEVEAVDLNQQPTPVATPTPQPVPAPVSQPVADTESDTSISGGDSRLVGALILLALAIIVVVLYLVFGRKKLGYSVDKELNSYVKESLKRGKSRDEVKQRLLEVGWHHDRVEKALSKYDKQKKSVESEHVKEISKELPTENNVSMSLAEAKALAAKQREALKSAKMSKTASKAKKK